MFFVRIVTNSFFRRTALISLAVFLAACSSSSDVAEDARVDVDWGDIAVSTGPQISWADDVQPVLEKRCVVCHGCFDAPCQLKLTSYEGLVRGANSTKVYDGSRIKAAAPSRLGIDAQTADEWQDMGFHPVLAESDVQSERDAADFMRQSVLYRLLRLKQRNPQPRTGLLPASVTTELGRKQVCTEQKDIAKFERDNPLWGMPYGMPNLPDEEYQTIMRWLAQGAQPPEPTIDADELLEQVERWEAFLNGSSIKEKLVSRYLYEHLFLGHLYFADSPYRQFYRFVRSYTPPGQPIREIPTVRPFDDPGVEEFWYRLRHHDASIVDKSHVIYQLSDAKMARIRELFLEIDYGVEELPSYALPEGANPFKTFASLPPESRYKFLLDDARFYIQGFIKGPVCRGQVALNVIEDQFWVMFVNPDSIDADDSSQILARAADYLKMPTKTQTFKLLAAYREYWDAQKEYLVLKNEYIERNLDQIEGKGLRLIWNGDGTNPNAALTIFRNFDSAAVEFGLLGQMPETAWIIDYPLLERIHYLLVAGFDVYGNVGHQLNTRLFMDFLRMEGEDNFLMFLPKSERQKIRAGWYEGIRSGRSKYFTETMGWSAWESPISFKTADVQPEFYRMIIDHLGPVSGGPDYLNRCSGDKCGTLVEATPMLDADAVMRELAQIQGEQLAVFPELSYVRVSNEEGPDIGYSLIKNNAWKNITSFLENAENAEPDPTGNTMTVLRGFSGSYPNFFFLVRGDELTAFVEHAKSVRNVDDYQLFVGRFGVRRTSTNFWKQADWFQDSYNAARPIEAGILDLNRYENR